jgi:mannose-6-phosphate isomerase-like protein (cupin superfamily)
MRIKTLLATAAFLTVSGVAVLAQAPAAKDVFKYTSPADVEKALQTHHDDGQATSSIARYADFSGVEVDRNKSGRVEIHDKWADFIRVIDGKATFTIGGTVAGKVVNGDPSRGEWYGDSSSGGQVYDMVAGATFVVPAGTPHWMQVPAGGHIHYIAFKHPAN